MKIGKHIQDILRQKRYSVSWFASQIFCTRSHAYKILKYENIDVLLLMRISRVLEYDFFKDLSEYYNSPPEEGEGEVCQDMTQIAADSDTKADVQNGANPVILQKQ